MQESERGRFEDNWKSKFEGAEMAPSDALWRSIETDLVGDESIRLKRRMIYWQRLAAAMLVFAIGSGVFAIYKATETTQVAANTSSEESLLLADENKAVQAPSAQIPVPAEEGVQPDNQSIKNSTRLPDKTIAKSSSTIFNHLTKQVNENTSLPMMTSPDNVIASQPLIDSVFHENISLQDALSLEIPSPVFTSKQATMDPLMPDPQNEQPPLLSADQINALAEEAQAKQKRKEKTENKSAWLAMGAAMGSYNPSAGLSNSADLLMSSPQTSGLQNNQPYSNRKSSGSSYSMGMLVGKKMSRRWTLQSGVNYTTQQIGYVSNFSSLSSNNVASAFVSDYYLKNNSAVAVGDVYDLNSKAEIVSIPLQGGFLVIDRKLGWQINTGISTDFFIKNTLNAKNGSVSSFSQSAGEASPYRTVNWSMLVNSELFYRLGRQYQVSLVPGFRYSFQSELKERNQSGLPLILDVGFRFKYIFD